MNKKLIVTLIAATTAGVMFARPGPGFHGGYGRFHGGYGRFHGPMHMYGPAPRFHHYHRHHCGWGFAGAMLGTAALVHDIVRPAPVVVAPAPIYAPAPVYAPVPVYAPAPVVVNPAPVVTPTTYVMPPPVLYR